MLPSCSIPLIVSPLVHEFIADSIIRWSLYANQLTNSKQSWKTQMARHCPAASNVGSGARSFKMIGEKKHLYLKWKNKVGREKISVMSSF